MSIFVGQTVVGQTVIGQTVTVAVALTVAEYIVWEILIWIIWGNLITWFVTVDLSVELNFFWRCE